MKVSSSWEIFLGYVEPFGSDLAGRLAHQAALDHERRASAKLEGERKRARVARKRKTGATTKTGRQVR